MAVDEPQGSFGHEIRSQLTVIKGYAQLVVRMLRRPDVPREEVLTQAEQLEQHVFELEDIAGSYLEEQDRGTGRSGRAEPVNEEPGTGADAFGADG